ncbi:MAG: hypothetical protein R3B93_23960 [Bacteroidia bacterium]
MNFSYYQGLRYFVIFIGLSGLFFLSFAQDTDQIEEELQEIESEEIIMDTLQYRNGAYYVGETYHRRPHGKGVYLKPDGDTIYAGFYRMGRKYGTGTYRFKNGNVYSGDWVEDRMEGKGSMMFANGETYIGDWVADQRHGEGTYTYGDGSFYEGTFLNGVREGRGTFTTDLKSYIGDWVNGVKNGEGYEVIMGADYMQEYRGGFVNSRYHGHGFFRHEKDTIIIEYIGNWRDGDRIGRGTYKINGRTIEGTWEENQTTGKGVSITEEGNVMKESLNVVFIMERGRLPIIIRRFMKVNGSVERSKA